MAVLLNPRERVEFIPADQAEKPEAERIAYILKVPTYWDRVAINRAIAAHGGRQHGLAALHGRIRAGLAQAFGAAPPADIQQAESLLAALEAEQAAGLAFLAQHAALDDAEARQEFMVLHARRQAAELAVSGLYDQFAAIDPGFAAMLGDNAVYHDIAAGVLIQILLLEWRGLGRPCQRGLEGLKPDMLDHLVRQRPGDVAALYQRLQGLKAPSEAEAGNSVSPSTGSGDMPSLATAQTEQAAPTSH